MENIRRFFLIGGSTICLFFLIWGFFWDSTLVIFVQNEEITSFKVFLSPEESVVCEKNPCEISLEAGRKLKGTVIAKGFVSYEFFTDKMPLWGEKKINLLFVKSPKIKKYSMQEYRTREARKQYDFSGQNNIFGEILVNFSGDFAIFAEKNNNKLLLRITDKEGHSEILTVLNGIFDVPNFNDLFQLQKTGVIIPEETGLYFFDFSLQKKQKIFEGNTENFEYVSVGNDGKFIVQLKNKQWFVGNQEGIQKLNTNDVAIGFYLGDLWKFDGQKVLIEDKVLFIFEENLKFYKTWFRDRVLFLEYESGILEVDFSSI